MHTYTYLGPQETASLASDRLQTIYVRPSDRYIVSLIAGYPDGRFDDTGERPIINCPSAAAFWAHRLTCDDDAPDTVWCVYDRVTKESVLLEQKELISIGAQYQRV